MNKAVFEFTNYKEFLKDRIFHSGTRGIVAQAAQAAGCQRSYLSQVLNTHVQLTPDHALGLANFFELNIDATDYFLLLVDLERAATISLRNRISTKLDKLKNDNRSVTNRIKKAAVTAHGQAPDFYYSSWHYAAIHVGTSSPNLRTPQALSKAISLPIQEVEAALDLLFKSKLVSKTNNAYQYAGGNVHLPDSSPWTRVNHLNWRNRSLFNLEKQSVHYTSVFSLSEEDYARISELLLEAIERSRKVIGKSPSDILSCCCVDLFKL